MTWAQYLAFCGKSGRPEPGKSPWWDRSPPFERLEHPVANVSWEEARAFCAWASLALPTEAEWEKAARGTDGRNYPWGNEEPTDEHAVFGKEKTMPTETAPAGSHPRGASPFGALDVAGNVWQWCEDAYDAKAYERFESGDAPSSADGPERVIRGGCWFGPGVFCRCSHRDKSLRTHHSRFFGFRAILRP